MSFATPGELAGRGRKTEYDENIQMVHNGPAPSAYRTNDVGQEDDPHWFDVRYWSRKAIIISIALIVIIIVIVIAVAVVMVKKNAYPDYSKLNYSLVDHCMQYLLVSPYHSAQQ